MTDKLKQIIIAAAILVALIAAVVIIFLERGKTDENEKLLTAAKAYYEAMDYDNAIAAYNTILKSDDSNTEAYIGLADVYYDKGNHEKAAEILERGLSDADDDEVIGDKYISFFGEEEFAEYIGADTEFPIDVVLTDETESVTEAITGVTEEDIVTETTTVPVETQTEAVTVSVTSQTEATTQPVTVTQPIVVTQPVTTTTRPVTTTTKSVTTTKPVTTTTEPTETSFTGHDDSGIDPAEMTIKVPNFVGQKKDYIFKIADMKNMMVTFIYEYNDEYTKDRAFAQSREPETKVSPDMMTYVYISLGSKKPAETTAAVTTVQGTITVPDFTAMSLDDAYEWGSANMVLINVKGTGSKVTAQSVAAKSKVNPGGTITLTCTK